LSLFFCHPERSYHATELIDLVAAGRGVVQRILTQLVASELVVAKERGRRRFFQANRASSLFAPLHDLLMKTIGVVDPVRDALHPLREHIHLALIYGSIAAGTETASSDVDVLVVSDDVTLEQLYEAFAVAERQVGRKISPTLYTSAELERRRVDGNPFLTKVLARDHITLIGSLDGTSEAR
jgi:predicted nucleotidyltransferase